MKKVISLLALAMLTMSAWAANTYVKVTSLDQLEIGKKYILVNEEANVGMGPLSSTNTVYGTTVDIIIANDAVDIEGTDVLELTAHKVNGEQGGWVFELSTDHFLVWTNGNSLNSTHNTSGVVSLNEQWYATSTDDGVVLKNRYDQTRVIQYNASAPRFACYTSSQQPAVLYVEGVPADDGIANLNEVNGLEEDANFEFAGNAVVTVCKNGYLFLRDETGYGMIQGVADGAFENGQVLSPGWSATKTSNDGWVRLIDPEGLNASGETNAELAAAQKLTGAVDESMINAYVYVEDVEKGFFPLRSLPLPDGTSIEITDCLWAMNQGASSHYNYYGVICKVDGALMFNLVKIEKYVAPSFIRGDVNNDTNINITDVTVLINYLLSHDATGVNLQAADCNQDNNVNITDVTVLITYLLSNSWD